MSDMLKAVPIKENEIVGFKDVAGEEFIGKIMTLTETEIVVRQPCHYSSGGDGNFRITPAFRVALHGMVVINRGNIIITHRIPDNLTEAYTKFVENG